MFPQEDSLRLFCCHRGHNEETKSVEFAFVAICLRLTHHNDCTTSRMQNWKELNVWSSNVYSCDFHEGRQYFITLLMLVLNFAF